MKFNDGSYKWGLFEHNVFIDEIIEEEDKEDETSILVDKKPPLIEKKQKKLQNIKTWLASSDIDDSPIDNYPHTSKAPLPKLKWLKIESSERKMVWDGSSAVIW